MSTSETQCQLLEITVVKCDKLKNTEWITQQDPYVCLEYGSVKRRTKTCRDGGKNPTFFEKFEFYLVQGLREISVAVWNSNTLTFDYFIGDGKIQLKKVLAQGYDDSVWPLQDKKGRHAGEVRLIMHYAKNDNPPPSPMYDGRSARFCPTPLVFGAYPPSAYPSDTAGYPPPSGYQQPPPVYHPSYPPPPSYIPPGTQPPGQHHYPHGSYTKNMYPPPF